MAEYSSDYKKFMGALNAPFQPVKPSFIDRLGNDASTFARGFIPGLLEIGKAPLADAKDMLFGGPGGNVERLATSMGKGIYESPLLGAPLRMGDEVGDIIRGEKPNLSRLIMGDAIQKSWQNPGFALLDALTLATAGAGTAGRAGGLTGPKMLDSVGMKGAADWLMQRKGYESLGTLDGVSNLQLNDFITPLRQDVPVKFRDQFYQRNTHRALYPKYEVTDKTRGNATDAQVAEANALGDLSIDGDPVHALKIRRAQNERIAKAGDKMWNLVNEKLPTNWLRLSPTSRFGSSLAYQMSRVLGMSNLSEQRVAETGARLAEAFPDVRDYAITGMTMEAAGASPRVMLERHADFDQFGNNLEGIPQELMDATNDTLVQHGLKIQRKSKYIGANDGTLVPDQEMTPRMLLNHVFQQIEKRKANERRDPMWQGNFDDSVHYELVLHSPYHRSVQDASLAEKGRSIDQSVARMDEFAGRGQSMEPRQTFKSSADGNGITPLEDIDAPEVDWTALSGDEREAIARELDDVYANAVKSIAYFKKVNDDQGLKRMGQVGVDSDLNEGRVDFVVGRRAIDNDRRWRAEKAQAGQGAETEGIVIVAPEIHFDERGYHTKNVAYHKDGQPVKSSDELDAEYDQFLASIDDRYPALSSLIERTGVDKEALLQQAFNATTGRIKERSRIAYMNDVARRSWQMVENQSKRALFTKRTGEFVRRDTSETGWHKRLREIAENDAKRARFLEITDSQQWRDFVNAVRATSEVRTKALESSHMTLIDRADLERRRTAVQQVFNFDGRYTNPAEQRQPFYLSLLRKAEPALDTRASDKKFRNMRNASLPVDNPLLSDMTGLINYDGIDELIDRSLKGFAEPMKRAAAKRAVFDLQKGIFDAAKRVKGDKVAELRKARLAGKIGDWETERHLAVIAADDPVIGKLMEFYDDIDILIDQATRDRNIEAMANLRDALHSTGMSSIYEWVNNARNQTKTKFPEKLKDVVDDEVFLVLPAPVARQIKYELSETSSRLYTNFKKATDVWKATILHARPFSWIRNNLIGSALFLYMHEDPVSATNALQRVRRGKKDLKRGIDSADAQAVRQFSEQYPEIAKGHGSSDFYKMVLSDMKDAGEQATGKVAGAKSAFKRWVTFWGDMNAKIADEPYRLARGIAEMERIVDNYSKLPGNEGKTWSQMADELSDNDIVREKILNEVFGDMVDFTSMTRTEREWLTQIMPFWSWVKGSNKSFVRLASDRPVVTYGMGQIAQLGERENIADFGKVAPDFARAWVKLPGGMVLNTAGFNPLQTPVDIGKMMMQWVPLPKQLGGASSIEYGGENLLNNINPFIANALQAASGRDLFFGSSIPNAAPGWTYAQRFMNNPMLNFGRTMLLGPQNGPTSTTSKTRMGELVKYLGLPIQRPNMWNVYQRGLDEGYQKYQSLDPIFAQQQDRPISK